MFDPADKDIARKIWNWIRTFSIAGPGVTMKNTGDSCTVFVSQSPGSTPAGAPATLAPVSLTTTGGANSTTTATATYTYTFTDPWTGLTVTGATPTWGRPPGPLTGPATHGIVYRTGGATSLLFTDEQAAVTTSCT
jgi:hypothetical protein